MNAGVYEEIWQAFITGDHISQGLIWGGEGLALVVPLDAAPASVQQKIGQIQAYLAGRLPFTPHLPETLHITLALFGSPPENRIPALSAFLRTELAPTRAFVVELHRVNSFFRAPFLEVADGGALDRLSARLQPGLAALGYPVLDYGPRGQVWHVTLGAYAAAGSGEAARALLHDLRDESAGSFMVRELRLVKTSAGAPYRLETLESYSLEEG